MSGNEANVRNWTEQIISRAPLGTTLPTTPTADLDPAFVELGFTDEDTGVKKSKSRTTNDKFATGGTLVRTTVTKQKSTFAFMALEENVAVQGVINPGGSVTDGDDFATIVEAAWVPGPGAWVVDRTDGDVIEREVYQRGDVVEAIGDIEIGDDKIPGYSITVTVYPVGGVASRRYTTDPALHAA